MSDELPIIIMGTLMVCAVGIYLWSLCRRIGQRGGVAGVLVGADIERTVDRVDAYSPGRTSGEMRVHLFTDAPSDSTVGLELMLRTAASYSSMTAGLSAAQARELANLLRRGIGETPVRTDPPRNVRDGPV